MIQNKKILFLIDSLGSGGAQRQIIHWANFLCEQNNKVEIAIYHDDIFYKNLNQKITIHKLNSKQIYRILDWFRLVNKIKPNDVISFLTIPNLMNISSSIFFNYNCIISERSHKILSSWIVKIICFLFYKISNKLVVNSITSQSFFKKYNNNVILVRNIISVDEIKLKTEKEHTTMHVGVFASHQFHKGLMKLVKSFSLLDNKLKDKIKITWYGKDNYDKSKIFAKREIINQNLSSFFIFKDAINNVQTEMVKYDFIGLFSDFEGSPNVIAEAVSLGIPVIMTDVSDCKYWLPNGNILTNHHAENISQALDRAYSTYKDSSKYYKISKSNKQIAKTVFDSKIIYNNINLILK